MICQILSFRQNITNIDEDRFMMMLSGSKQFQCLLSYHWISLFAFKFDLEWRNLTWTHEKRCEFSSHIKRLEQKTSKDGVIATSKEARKDGDGSFVLCEICHLFGRLSVSARQHVRNPAAVALRSVGVLSFATEKKSERNREISLEFLFFFTWKAKCPIFKAIVAGFRGKVA